MARFLAPIALALSVALCGAASAANYGDGLKMSAQLGTLTPHGVWDGR